MEENFEKKVETNVEKTFEEKLMDEEGMKTTPNHLIHIGKPIEISDKEPKSTKITENEIKYEYVIFDSKTFVNEYHFENNIKNKEKVYLSSTKYYENAFFEGDIKIYSEYENNLKQLEITYFQGKELRRK